MDWITSFLDYASVVCALAIAVKGQIPLKGGKNHYERKLDALARNWNNIWAFFFWACFGTATLSLALKYGSMLWMPGL